MQTDPNGYVLLDTSHPNTYVQSILHDSQRKSAAQVEPGLRSNEFHASQNERYQLQTAVSQNINPAQPVRHISQLPQHHTAVGHQSWQTSNSVSEDPGLNYMAGRPGANALLSAGVHPHQKMAVVDERLSELQHEMEKLRFEREHVSSLRTEMERAAQALERERGLFLQQRVRYLG